MKVFFPIKSNVDCCSLLIFVSLPVINHAKLIVVGRIHYSDGTCSKSDYPLVLLRVAIIITQLKTLKNES